MPEQTFEGSGPFRKYEDALNQPSGIGATPEPKQTEASMALFRILNEAEILKESAKQAMLNMEDGDAHLQKQSQERLSTLTPMFQRLHREAAEVSLSMSDTERRYFQKMLTRLQTEKAQEQEVSDASRSEMANAAIMNQMMQQWQQPSEPFVGPPAPKMGMDEMMRQQTTPQAQPQPSPMYPPPVGN